MATKEHISSAMEAMGLMVVPSASHRDPDRSASLVEMGQQVLRSDAVSWNGRIGRHQRVERRPGVERRRRGHGGCGVDALGGTESGDGYLDHVRQSKFFFEDGGGEKE
jgi:hypothetical protein